MPVHPSPLPLPAGKSEKIWRCAKFFFFAQKLRKKYMQISVDICKKCCAQFSAEAKATFYGVTVMFKAAEWLAPDVAVTVMLKVPGGVPFCGFCCGPPPPQLTRQSSSAMQPKTTE